jgi:hypothetical protein
MRRLAIARKSGTITRRIYSLGRLKAVCSGDDGEPVVAVMEPGED